MRRAGTAPPRGARAPAEPAAVAAQSWLGRPEEAAYDAPFPSRIYLAGARAFPSLVNQLAGANDAAWAGLLAYERPSLTIWSSNDPGLLGSCEVQDELIASIPGAAGRPHVRLVEASHFLQDDQGPEIARRIVELIAATPRGAARRRR